MFGCGGCAEEVRGTFDPAWLAMPRPGDFLSVAPRERFGPLDLRFPPDGPGRPEPGSIIRVVGHFDDPAARGCTVQPQDSAEPVMPEVAELHCREQFVVEAIEVLGTDEDFPGGP
ncbi:MAG: hypothetical protein LC798_14995 [Chloroflexi bacterium]|nr:hypothetical protein [Chloroflexota bacterium]